MKYINQKLQIEYPCRWVFKVIGQNPSKIKDAIAGIVQDQDHSISLSNMSQGGNYHCLNLTMIIDCEDKRVSIYEALKKHPEIIIVL